jgi:hypothetical protein
MSCRWYAVVSVLAIILAGCAPQQPYVVAPQVGDPPNIGASAPTGPANAQVTNSNNFANANTHPNAPMRQLPYKGRLVDGDPTELPPAIAASLSKDAPITFSYREELTHDEYHIPYIVSSFDPVTYLGAPLGDYAVTATATLTISEGNRTIADYTAKARVSKSYSVYSEPKHSELERAAREAVRARIDQKLYADANRVARSTPPSPAVPE